MEGKCDYIEASKEEFFLEVKKCPNWALGVEYFSTRDCYLYSNKSNGAIIGCEYLYDCPKYFLLKEIVCSNG